MIFIESTIQTFWYFFDVKKHIHMRLASLHILRYNNTFLDNSISIDYRIQCACVDIVWTDANIIDNVHRTIICVWEYLRFLIINFKIQKVLSALFFLNVFFFMPSLYKNNLFFKHTRVFF